MTASEQPKLTYKRPAGLLTDKHAKAAAKPAQKLLGHNAPAGLLGYTPEQTTEQPGLAGFRTRARAAKTESGNGTIPVPGTSLVPLMPSFDNAAFLKLLAQIYGVQEIEKARAEKLRDFTLDASKGAQTGADGKLFAKLGDASVEITKESVLTNAPVTPALAYQMAAAVAANPNSGKLILEGTEDEKIMFFFAAQQMGLEIEESSIPEVPANIADLAQKFHAYEKAMNLPSIAGSYIPPEKTQTHARKNPERSSQTSYAPMGALSPA